MVSISNGGLSGEASNKRPLENGYVPKYKPRRVSAVRDFPPGCGPNAAPINLKPEANGGSVEANSVGSSQMAVIIESEAVGNPEMTNGMESNGVNAAEMAEFVKDENEIKDSENQNVVGSSGVKKSNIKVECESHEAVNNLVDIDMTESLDELVGKIVVNAEIDEKFLMEIGPIGIQLPNEVEYHGHEAIDNSVEVERGETLDALGKVVTTTMEGFSNAAEELMTENQLIGVDTLKDMKSDCSDKEIGAGGQKIFKELNDTLATGASVDKEVLLGNSQALSSVFASNGAEPSMRPKDKFRPRKVSAVRDFPPLCGRNVPLPIEDKKRTVTAGNDCPDGIEKAVVVAPESTPTMNVTEGGTMVEIPVASQRKCSDGLNNSHLKSTALNDDDDDAGRGPLGQMTEAVVEPVVANFEECKPVENEIIVYSADKKDKAGALHTGFTSGNESHRTIVHALMAAPNCPWRKAEATANNSEGKKSAKKRFRLKKKDVTALTSNHNPDCSRGPSREKTAFPDSNDVEGNPGGLLSLKEEKDRGTDDEEIPEITPIFMYRDNNDSDSEEPVGKDIVVYSPGASDEKKPDEEVDRKVAHGLMAAPNRPWKKGKTVSSNHDRGTSGEKNTEQNYSWRKKAKAVAKKSTFKVQSPGLPSKKHKKVHISNDSDNEGRGHNRDLPASSTARRHRQDVEVNVPPFGPNSSSGHGDARHKVRETLRLFNAVCRKILQQQESNSMPKEEGKSRKKAMRIDLLAGAKIKEKGKLVNNGKKYIIGEVPGVEVGDEFQYRVELAIVGIHRSYQGGIDSTKLNNGMSVATSIVSSGSYADDLENADVLIYSGQGGNVVGKQKEKPEDQKLERGNLALKNCITTATPVRVVRGWKEKVVDPSDTKPKMAMTYVYDGLYTVKNYWTEKGPHGKQVFMFELRRNPGQPELAWKELKKTNKSKFRPGLCVPDITGGKEKIAISAVNTFDDEKPPHFNYTSKMIYPIGHVSTPPAGCDCKGRCSDSRKCKCAVRNGGEIPYNHNGALVETKLLVYECGPHCKCPPSCYNRVSQRGIKFQLEIFKTESRGWGVRALTSIPSGSFICEYAGELLEDKEAEQRIGNDEYLFDIGQNMTDSSLNNPEDQAICAELVEDGGYTIDAERYGSIGRFINHSCSPNLYAQNVIYDHNDMKMPHVMLFAMENIPPLQELTYHYHYSVDQIRDSNGNIKVKKCYCGTAECTGRMY